MKKSSTEGISFAALVERGVYYFPFALFFLLVLLSVFTYPSAEDLAILHFDKSEGLWNYMREFYHANCSRYFSFPLLFLLLDGGFLPGHYYLVAVVLFAGLWTGLYFLLRMLTRLSMDAWPGGRWCAWLATVVLLAIFSILFQPASIFYWVSGSVIYLPGFVLFLFLLAILLRVAVRGRAKTGEALATVLLVVAITGANEIAMYFLVIVLVWIQGGYYSITGKFLKLVNILGVVVVVCVAVFILPGGTSQRAGHFRSTFGVGRSLIEAVVYTVRDYLRLMASPLAWLGMVLAWAGGVSAKAEVRRRLSGSRWFHPLACLIPALPGVAFFYFVIYLVSGEVLPPRANGLLLFYIFFFWLAAFYAYGLRGNKVDVLPGMLRRRPVVALLVLFIFAGSPLCYQAVGDVYTGVIYGKVMKGRERAIAGSRARGKVVLRPYEEDYEAVASGLLPRDVREQGVQKAPRYPQLIFYQDPLADTDLYIHYYAEYYGIDTISYLGRDYLRIGLIESKERQ